MKAGRNRIKTASDSAPRCGVDYAFVRLCVTS